MKNYLVGGAIRDELLGRPVKERDWVVVGATPEALVERGFTPVGKDFPVFLHPETREEYALARTERKTAAGYRGFQVHTDPDVSLEEDLARRDLTINAMARDRHGSLVDPFGGAADLRNRWLRHVSPAFVEDPVRVLRIARFQARYHHLGFRIAPATLALLRELVDSGEVDALVPERVWAETLKALAEPHPAVFFLALRECGALTRIFPELERLFGIPQPARYHPEVDTGDHVLRALQSTVALDADLPTRFAVLVHDLGKGSTPPRHWPRHPDHEECGAEMVLTLAARLKIPNEFRALGSMTAQEHTRVHRSLEAHPGTLLEILERTDAFRRPQRFRQMLLACEADARGRLGLEQRDYPQPARLLRALAAAEGVSGKALAEEGYQGKELAAKLRVRRLRAVTAALRDQPSR